MNGRSFDIHPEAIREARSAQLWYWRHSEQASRNFESALVAAIDEIRNRPETGQPYLLLTRRRRLRRFPYLVVYVFDSNHVRLLAVAHMKRREGYWRRRLRWRP